MEAYGGSHRAAMAQPGVSPPALDSFFADVQAAGRLARTGPHSSCSLPRQRKPWLRPRR